MVNVKLSELTEITEVKEDDYFIVVDTSDSNNTKKVKAVNKNEKVGVYGYVVTPVETDCALAGVPVPLAGTFNNDILEGFEISATTDKLTYIGAGDITVEIQYSGSFTSTKNNALISVGIAKNGTPITGSDMERTLSIGDIGSWASTCAIMLSTGDTIEIVAKSDTANTGVTATKFNTTLQRLW